MLVNATWVCKDSQFKKINWDLLCRGGWEIYQPLPEFVMLLCCCSCDSSCDKCAQHYQGWMSIAASLKHTQFRSFIWSQQIFSKSQHSERLQCQITILGRPHFDFSSPQCDWQHPNDWHSAWPHTSFTSLFTEKTQSGWWMVTVSHLKAGKKWSCIAHFI